MAITKVTSGLTDLDGGITIDNITIDGTEIDLSSGDLTIDVAGVINLDADGAEIAFKDGGTHIGSIINNNSDFVFRSIVQDKDVLIKGNDGGTAITAVTFDMSAAGAATFNSTVTVGDTVFDAVGTYCFATSAGSVADRDGGATLAGSNLKPSNSYTDYSGTAGYSNETLSGTWRLMGSTGEYNNGTASVLVSLMGSLWVRIS